MNLTASQIEELNVLLAKTKLNLPDFRKSVTIAGGNYKWLHTNIERHNPSLPSRLKELLGLQQPSQDDSKSKSQVEGTKERDSNGLQLHSRLPKGSAATATPNP